ncbi:MAG: hypothetical protein AUG44_28980 [Actinobacteria bacterium 13_1_20CM_3_71_11]|nr:MAG: hypothetical protein AUG44_28980 [Actinobacteria bacterium 13_1_20CM_3_71_11]
MAGSARTGVAGVRTAGAPSAYRPPDLRRHRRRAGGGRGRRPGPDRPPARSPDSRRATAARPQRRAVSEHRALGEHRRRARLTRQDCAGPYFATVLARVAGAADCPTDTLSRIGDAGQVLCLGQGARGAMARPGDCVRVPTGFQLPLIRTDCASATKPFRLEAVVDDPARCPTGTQGAPYSGYDRPLCIRFPQ